MQNDLTKEQIATFIKMRIAQYIDKKATDIQGDMPFMRIGLTSMQAISLMHDLELMLDVKLKPLILFNNPNVDSLSQFLYDLANNKASLEDHSESMKVLLEDVKVKLSCTNKQCESINLNNCNVLLTGADGFLGIHLLKYLLKSKSGKIYCLIRESIPGNAQEKIQAAIEKYKISIDFQENRIIIIPGDISRSNLGVDQNVYKQMSDDVDVIIHCAAKVNHVFDYSLLRDDNVLSLDNILDLSNTGKFKAIHFISTSPVASYLRFKLFTGTEVLPSSIPSVVSNGYLLSKIVAEIKLKNAINAGFRVNVYRPCQMLANSYVGRIDPGRDEFLSLIKGCLLLQGFPSMNFELNLLTADMAANAITQSILKETEYNKVYNIVNTPSIEWKEFLNWLQNLGYSFSSVSALDFIKNYVPKIDTKNPFYIYKDNIAKGGFMRDINKLAVEPKNILKTLDNPSVLNFDEQQFAEIFKTLEWWFKEQN